MTISVENKQNSPTPAEGVPAMGVRKLEWWATWLTKKFDDIFSRLDTMHQHDGRTDRHQATAKTVLMQSIEW